MTVTTGLAVADHGDRCGDCGLSLPERGPNSPEVRRCETCWWAHQREQFAAGGEVHKYARPWLERSKR